MDYLVKQGDQYMVPFFVVMGRYILDPNQLEEVVISFGPELVKSWKAGEVQYNGRRHCFEFPLTEEETSSLYPGMRLCSEVRYKLKQFDDNPNVLVRSFEGPSIVIVNSNSKEII